MSKRDLSPMGCIVAMQQMMDEGIWPWSFAIDFKLAATSNHEAIRGINPTLRGDIPIADNDNNRT